MPHAPAPVRSVVPEDGHASLEAMREGGRLLRAGGLVAFPTETVYGLGANALDAAAVRRIFEAKGRPAYNPVIVHVADTPQVADIVQHMGVAATALAEAFWPGPLTLVLPRRDVVPPVVTAGLDLVGVRVPAHPIARALIREAGVPVAAPSANLFTRVSPTTAQHVATQMGDRIDLILDAGPTAVGIESTVVEVASGGRPRLLRHGGISRAALEDVVGPIDDASRGGEGTAPRPAPGMLDRHYAPHARLIAFPSRARNTAQRALDAARASGARAGAIVFPDTDLTADLVVRLPRDAAGYARGLYAALHALDQAGCALAYVEAAPGTPDWEAIADRLRRAGLAEAGAPPP